MNVDGGAPESAALEVGEASGDKVLLLTDPAMERHTAPGHPERHERLASACRAPVPDQEATF